MTEVASKAPYPGLRSFERSESRLFFGRDNCVDAMIERLEKTRFLAVLGSSGTGKSSLVKTGLLSGLEMGLLSDAGSRWRVIDFRPGGDPLGRLAEGLVKAQSTDPNAPADAAEVATLVARFKREGPRELIRWCREGHLPAETSLLLLVDQFEELFRYQDTAQREMARAFVSLLLESRWPRGTASPQQSEIPIFVTITMRSEFLGACALMPGLAEAINEGTFLTPRMTRQQCEEAIVGPAEVCGVKIEDRLVTRLLNDMADFAPWDEQGESTDQLSRLAREADQLPLMQHALNQMWQRAVGQAKPGQTIMLMADEYRGLERELDEHAEQEYAGLNEREQGVAGAVFRAITTGTTVANAVRRPTRYAELLAICGESHRDHLSTVFKAFGPDRAQFLTSDVKLDGSSPPDTAWIDISHESLIRQWRRLSGWVESEGQAAHEWQQLDEEAKHYVATHPGGGRLWSLLSGNMLLSGWKLRRALGLRKADPTPAWAKRYGVDLGGIRSFVSRSRIHRRLYISYFVVFFIVVSAAGTWEVVQIQQNELKALEMQKQRELAMLEMKRQQDEANRSKPFREATVSASKQFLPFANRLFDDLLPPHRNAAAFDDDVRPATPDRKDDQSRLEKNSHLADLVWQLRNLFSSGLPQPDSQLATYLQDRFDLVYGDTVAAGLYYLLANKDSRDSKHFYEDLKNIYAHADELMAKIEHDNVEISFEKAKSFYAAFSLLADAVKSASQNDDPRSRLLSKPQNNAPKTEVQNDPNTYQSKAFDLVLAILNHFTSKSENSAEDRQQAFQWIAETWARRCQAVLNVGAKVSEDAVACFDNAVAARNRALELTPSWVDKTNLHLDQSDLYSLEMRFAPDALKNDLRNKKIGELRAAVHLVQASLGKDFEHDFKQMLDRFNQPGEWRKQLEVLSGDALPPAALVQDWLAERNTPYALERSGWIAQRLNELAGLYDENGMLSEARTARLLQFEYRQALAAKEQIEATMLKLQAEAATLRNSDRESKLATRRDQNSVEEKDDANRSDRGQLVKTVAELERQTRWLQKYGHDLAKQELVRAFSLIGRLEGQPKREQDMAGKLFQSSIRIAETLIPAKVREPDQIAKDKTIDPLSVKALAGAYRDMAWWAMSEARNASDTTAKRASYRQARQFYLDAADLYQAVLYLKLSAKETNDIADDLADSLATGANAIIHYALLSGDKYRIADAVRYDQRAINVAQTLGPQMMTSRAKNTLAIRYGVHAWYLVLAARPADALVAAKTAIQVKYDLKEVDQGLELDRVRKSKDRDDLVIWLNFAHAELFSGNYQAAQDIYSAITKNADFSETARTEIINDFKDLRDVGVTHPRMCDIGKMVNDEAYAKQNCDAAPPKPNPVPAQP